MKIQAFSPSRAACAATALARLPVEEHETVSKPKARACESATATTRSLKLSVGRQTASFLMYRFARQRFRSSVSPSAEPANSGVKPTGNRGVKPGGGATARSSATCLAAAEKCFSRLTALAARRSRRRLPGGKNNRRRWSGAGFPRSVRIRGTAIRNETSCYSLSCE